MAWTALPCLRKLARADRRVKRRSWKPHLGWRVIGQDGHDGEDEDGDDDDGDDEDDDDDDDDYDDDRRVETVISVKHNQCDGHIISSDNEA